MEVASDEDLLMLKMVVEEIKPEIVAAEAELRVGAIDSAIDRAAARGILLQPQSRIRRDPNSFPMREDTDEGFLSSPTFALQWHITQACDLRCKHCYDRSSRSPLKLDQALRILDDLRAFCRSRYVKGHVSFTGGNPLLYPHFSELYRAASERGFTVAILGNPAPKQRIEELINIVPPDFFQTSLEGLPEHNDSIRGAGHFQRVIEFLKVLRDLGVYSMIMLTLTDDNVDQILPLTEMLREHTNAFFFNRLSMVGEGANLQLPSPEKFAAFLEQYLEAAKSNPILGLKDNLFNIVHHNRGIELFEGCTGYGCGAAFNFVAILSDGEVHACRKFPSPIGNIFEQSLAEIYDSEIAQQYRAGCNACRSCAIRPVCSGCLAIAYSHGLNVFEERDPHCFMRMSQ
jgi:selenobiotic family peptide radical SAM maturase